MRNERRIDEYQYLMWQIKSFRNRSHRTNVGGWKEGRSVETKKMKTCSGIFFQGLGTFCQGLLGLPAWQPWLLSHPHPVICECCVCLDRGFKAKHFWTGRNSLDLLLGERSLGNNCPLPFFFQSDLYHWTAWTSKKCLCMVMLKVKAKVAGFARKAAVQSWQTPLINETPFSGVLLSGYEQHRCSWRIQEMLSFLPK